MDRFTQGTWFISEVPTCYRKNGQIVKEYMEVYVLSRYFFDRHYDNFNDAIVYINACDSWAFIENTPFNTARARLGYTNDTTIIALVAPNFGKYISYYFFHYIVHGYVAPERLFPVEEWNFIINPDPIPQGPMSVQKAFQTFSDVYETKTEAEDSANPDPREYPENDPCEGCNDTRLELQVNYQNEEIYFPVPVTLTIQEE